jgi:hypothetical protein
MGQEPYQDVGREHTFAHLKQKHRAVRGGFPESLGLRVHRALSWLGRAEVETEDPDIRFILLWVGFNAAYAAEIDRESESERGVFQTFFEAVVQLDTRDRIYTAVWRRFPHEIRLLLANRHIYSAFWKHQNGVQGYEDWAERMSKSQRALNGAIAHKDTAKILAVLFDRLYVLRNQLIHGGATWNSGVNRSQVNDGAALLGVLLPVFIDILMDNPSHDWGKPYYPVVEVLT